MPAVILPGQYCSGTSFKGHLLLQRYSAVGMWQNAIILQPRIKTCCIMTPRELLWVSLHNTFVTYEESAWGARVEVCVRVCVCVGEWLCKTEQLKMCASHCRDTFPLTDLCPRPTTAMSPHTHTHTKPAMWSNSPLFTYCKVRQWELVFGRTGSGKVTELRQLYGDKRRQVREDVR